MPDQNPRPTVSCVHLMWPTRLTKNQEEEETCCWMGRRAPVSQNRHRTKSVSAPLFVLGSQDARPPLVLVEAAAFWWHCHFAVPKRALSPQCTLASHYAPHQELPMPFLESCARPSSAAGQWAAASGHSTSSGRCVNLTKVEKAGGAPGHC